MKRLLFWHDEVGRLLSRSALTLQTLPDLTRASLGLLGPLCPSIIRDGARLLSESIGKEDQKGPDPLICEVRVFKVLHLGLPVSYGRKH